MQNINIQRKDINLERFDEELKSALGQNFIGVSNQRGQIVVHLQDDATENDRLKLEQTIFEHNPAALSERERKTAILESERDQFAEPLDPNASQNHSTDPVVNTMLERLVWLENEIRDLRGI